jgi:hypothetical protein
VLVDEQEEVDGQVVVDEQEEVVSQVEQEFIDLQLSHVRSQELQDVIYTLG